MSESLSCKWAACGPACLSEIDLRQFPLRIDPSSTRCYLHPPCPVSSPLLRLQAQLALLPLTRPVPLPLSRPVPVPSPLSRLPFRSLNVLLCLFIGELHLRAPTSFSCTAHPDPGKAKRYRVRVVMQGPYRTTSASAEQVLSCRCASIFSL